ncbi:DUF6233 domain-containing protein [Streptomyces sp. NRRL S-340]|uniref:DUF6233 domain-containing protein n=1 Tax=Streptomyces sp. NRRL S-340 TaxID=1463901 RepID=UPI001F410943|nr:DUF6233 domain-containing protein [Streptomyces sp. NRRL S-340]
MHHGLNRTKVDAVHTSGCRAAAKSSRCRPLTRQQAIEALRRQVPSVPAAGPIRPRASWTVPHQAPFAPARSGS